MLIGFKEFGGISPRYSDRRLPMPYAVTADNCKMDRGQLRGFGGKEQVFNSTPIINSVQTFHIYEPNSTEYLLQWPTKVSVVDEANVSDSYHRIYWTDESGVPQMGAENDIIFGAAPFPYRSYDLGVPSPLGYITLTRNTTADSPSQEDIDDGKATPYFRTYTYTYVNEYGEESPPYTPSNGEDLPRILLYEGDSVTVDNLATAPAGNYPFNLANGAKKRIYQTDTSGNFRLVAEVVLTDTSWTGLHMSFDSSAMMDTQIFLGAQPLSNLQGLVYHSAGYMLGFVGNTLATSSRYLFHNWPVTHQRAASSKILGLVVVAQGVLVITEDGLYVAIGKDPSNLDIVKIDDTLGCVSKDSIVDMGGYALYAGANGIVYADVNNSSVVTTDVILENDWHTYDPATMVGYRHLHRYIIKNATHSFVINPKGNSDRLVTFDTDIEAGFTSKEDGHLYYTDSQSGGPIYRFDSDATAPIPYKWTSATYISKEPVIVSCFKVDAEDFLDVTVQVFVDTIPLFAGAGLTLDASYVDSKNEHIMYGRLPSFPSALDVVVELTGSSPINSVMLSDSFEEIKRG